MENQGKMFNILRGILEHKEKQKKILEIKKISEK